jgi:hypothetical protein
MGKTKCYFLRKVVGNAIPLSLVLMRRLFVFWNNCETQNVGFSIISKPGVVGVYLSKFKMYEVIDGNVLWANLSNNKMHFIMKNKTIHFMIA